MPRKAPLERLVGPELSEAGMVQAVVVAAYVIEPDGAGVTYTLWDEDSSLPMCRGLAAILSEDISQAMFRDRDVD